MDQKKLERLLLAKTRKTAACWEFTGYRDPRGYGRQWNGIKPALSHRVAYELWVGPIPDGLTVDHMCFNPSCVNPTHLQLLTHAENCRLALFGRRSQCSAGHDYTPANTRIQVRERSGTLERVCRECNRLACARYHARKRAA
jgi:hypothetical protein